MAETVDLINPSNELVSLPKEVAAQAISDGGYRQPTAQDIKAYDNQQKYGTTGQQAIGFAEQVGQGALGPLAPMAERALGVKAEDISGREEQLPGAAKILGQGAGLAGGLLLPGGGQAGLLEKLGAGAAEALNLGKIGSLAAKEAVANAAFQSGDEVSKMVLQDPDQSAGSALAHIGLASAIGAAGGIAIGGGQALWDVTAGKKLNQFLGKTAEAINKDPIAEIYDPFLKKKVPGKMPGAEPQPKGMDLSEIIPMGVGAAVSMAMGHNPLWGMFAGKLGKYIGPHVEDALKTSFLKFLGSEEGISGSAFKAMNDYVGYIIKGQKLMFNAAEMAMKPGASVMSESLYPSQQERDKLEKHLIQIESGQKDLLGMAEGLSHYMPDHAEALTKGTMQAVQYLNSIKPQSIKQNMFDKPTKPDATQMANYNNALDIAIQPLTVCDSIQKGTLTPQEKEHLINIHPHVYSTLLKNFTHHLIDMSHDEKQMDYKQRLSLGLFMDQPLDSTMTPEAILTNQMSGMSQKQEPQLPNGDMSKAGKMAQSSQTPGQAREASKLKA